MYRRSFLRGAAATGIVLASPPIIRAMRRAFFPQHGPWRFKEVAENIFVIEDRIVGFEYLQRLAGKKDAHPLLNAQWFDALFGVPKAYANFTPPPNDTNYSGQWFLGVGYLDVVTAWATSQGDPGTVISNLDTGVTLITDNPTSTRTGFNFLYPAGDGCNNVSNTTTKDCSSVGLSHGTGVAGILVGATNNAALTAGIAPNCTLMPLVVANPNGSINQAAALSAISYAASNGVHILNMSFAGSLTATNYNSTTAAAWASGCLLVGGMTDNSSDVPDTGPACSTNVIGVGGLTDQNVIWHSGTIGAGASGSGFDGQLIMAYSGGPPSTSSQFIFWDAKDDTVQTNTIGGNSAATPMVAGILGLIRKGATGLFYESLRNQECYDALLSGAVQVQTSTVYVPGAGSVPDVHYGFGRASAPGALAKALAVTRPYPLGGL